MSRLHFLDSQIDTLPGESVLDAFLRQGISIPFSCRGGICHVCLQRCLEGEIPDGARKGLRPELVADGYFMPCQCVPITDLRIEPARREDFYLEAMVAEKDFPSPDICRLKLEPARPLAYRPGQFINLRGANGLVRSYSLASLPEDYLLEIHVKRMENGAMSNWIWDALRVGDGVDIQGPGGDCVYFTAAPEQPLLLVGTGSGLAPLWGIIREALQSGHQGEILLYHGSSLSSGHYLHAPLRELERRHANFRYFPCVSQQENVPDRLTGRAHILAMAQTPYLRDWRIYVAGLPRMVHEAEQLAIAHGAKPERIHSDPFLPRDLRRQPRLAALDTAGETPVPVAGKSSDKPKDPPPDPELWHALGDGTLVREILEEFYSRVYADAQLAPFFKNFTKQRLVEKQYSFLHQVMTGKKVYFGDRPRNAHHWMVISDELFDYRENLMLSCMRDHGVAESLVERWLVIENHFRDEIVKSAPSPRIVGGTEMPLEGFEELVIDSGTLCDGCGREIRVGEHIRYHVRLGTTYCSLCIGSGRARNKPETG